MALAMAVGMMATQSVRAVDNTGTGGVIMYTDSNGSNAVVSPPYIGGYVVHTFTNSGTYSNSYAVSADVLVVAGGGGGGYNPGNWEGSGGGAGGYLQENAALSAQSYTITVGAGGAVGNPAANGQPSSVVGTGVNVEAVGGGGGSGRAAPTSGGSGGGNANGLGAPGTPGQGNAGGRDINQSGAGGGGGADEQGKDGVNNTLGGNGGAGKFNSLSGVSTPYAGGGGGGGWDQGTTTSSGGVGGGGNGGSGGTLAGTAGVDGTGGGGGGGGSSSAGGKGGSGIVIVRYPYDAGMSAFFTATPTNGYAPLAVTFADTSTGSITNRYWDFGDSGTTNFPGTNPPPANFTYTYNSVSNYTVTLTVTNDSGQASSTNTTISVAAVPTPSLAGAGAVSLNPDTGYATFTFTGTSGVQYQIVYKDDLLDPSPWQPVIPTNWVSGTNGPLVLQDTSTAAVTQRFYKVEAKSVDAQ